MKERGMIFNEYQVRALLDGSMTQVRRVIHSGAKNMQARGHEVISYREPGDKWYGDYVYSMRDRSGVWQDFTNEQFLAKCPHGVAGDRLYVRETFSHLHQFNFFDPAVPHEVPDFWYWADGEPEWGDWTRPQSGAVMPREASRITLEITSVRAERLQAADESCLLDQLGDMLEHCDSVAGRAFNHAEHHAIAGVPVGMCPEMHGFKAWWDKVNGAGSFDSNPWVWMIEFKRVEVNCDE
ncbi:hypothetical protein [Atlantibacter hermannii]|uniref:hypothetical protein n=1 Tax=Atlantibacter hermannii TaxID=565 RepID=UPI0028A226E9|nr:hypothetical protein [Atlantibacter hermannii]